MITEQSGQFVGFWPSFSFSRSSLITASMKRTDSILSWICRPWSDSSGLALAQKHILGAPFETVSMLKNTQSYSCCWFLVKETCIFPMFFGSYFQEPVEAHAGEEEVFAWTKANKRRKGPHVWQQSARAVINCGLVVLWLTHSFSTFLFVCL